MNINRTLRNLAATLNGYVPTPGINKSTAAALTAIASVAIAFYAENQYDALSNLGRAVYALAADPAVELFAYAAMFAAPFVINHFVPRQPPAQAVNVIPLEPPALEPNAIAEPAAQAPIPANLAAVENTLHSNQSELEKIEQQLERLTQTCAQTQTVVARLQEDKASLEEKLQAAQSRLSECSPTDLTREDRLENRNARKIVHHLNGVLRATNRQIEQSSKKHEGHLAEHQSVSDVRNELQGRIQDLTGTLNRLRGIDEVIAAYAPLSTLERIRVDEMILQNLPPPAIRASLDLIRNSIFQLTNGSEDGSMALVSATQSNASPDVASPSRDFRSVSEEAAADALPSTEEGIDPDEMDLQTLPESIEDSAGDDAVSRTPSPAPEQFFQLASGSEGGPIVLVPETPPSPTPSIQAEIALDEDSDGVPFSASELIEPFPLTPSSPNLASAAE